MNFERIIIIICIINFALVGAIGIIDHQWLASNNGFSLNTGLAHSEIVAMYGGFQIGLMFFFLMSYSRPSWHKPALYVAAFTMAGIAVGRVIAAIKIGLPESIGITLFVIEVICTIVIAACIRNMTVRNNASQAS